EPVAAVPVLELDVITAMVDREALPCERLGRPPATGDRALEGCSVRCSRAAEKGRLAATFPRLDARKHLVQANVLDPSPSSGRHSRALCSSALSSSNAEGFERLRISL